MRLSAEITGVADLDPGLGQTIYALLGLESQIDSLLQRSPEDSAAEARAALEVEVISAWYSGIVESAAGPRLASYEEALMWRALDFTKPMGYCGDGFGSWALPPEL